MKWFFKVLRQYADFKGRASREEFWMFALFYLIVAFVITLFSLGLMQLSGKTGALLLPFLFIFALSIPSWAVVIRRLHDIGKSAWYLLINLIPIVGGILLLLKLIAKGNSDTNQYGKTPETILTKGYNRLRSASVALIIASVCWLLSRAIFILFVGVAVNSYMLLSLLLPICLIITGSILFSQRAFSMEMACSLVVLSLIWLIIDIFVIRDSISDLLISLNIPLAINLFTVLIPIALLLSGIYIFIKKSDRTVPACLLFVGACIWILSIVLKIINIPDMQRYMFIYISTMIEIVVPLSLMVLARTMLSKNISANKSKNETEELLLTEKPIAVQPIISQPTERLVKPEIVQIAKPSEQQKAVQVIEKLISPAIVQIAEPEWKPDAVQAVEKKKQPKPDKPVEQVGSEVDTLTKPPVKKTQTVQIPGPKPVRKLSSTDEGQKGVFFLREDRDDNNHWVIYQAPTKAVAMMFLSRQMVTRPSYFVVVETLEGNFGKDKDGIYQE